MSFFSKLGNLANKAITFVKGNDTAKSLLKVAALGYVNKTLTKSINKSNDRVVSPSNSPTQPTVNKIEFDPDPNARIPVVYGSCYVNGQIVDVATKSEDCKTLWIAIVLSEYTGNKLDGTPSVLTVTECWLNGYKLQFGGDGITASQGVNDEGEVNSNLAGKVRVYPFSGNSTSPSNIGSLSSGNTLSASALFPEWTAAHNMSDLLFVLVSIDYYPTGGITGAGSWQFKVNNTMTQPGDVLYDYMTNTRYGGSIPETEINLNG